MIGYVEGDLFGPIQQVKDKIIVMPHVVNNKGGFGSGFVIPLTKHYPKAKESYKLWHEGTMQAAPIFELGQTLFVNLDSGLTLAHMCAQTLGGSRPLYYNALAKCMDAVGQYAKDTHAVIVAPAFGSGLAGGDWSFIEKLIEDCWIRDRKLDVTIYYLPGTLSV